MSSLIALDAASGELLWSYQHPVQMNAVSAPLVHRGAIYLGTEDARQPLVAVHTRTHDLLWTFRPGKPDFSEWGGGLLLAGETVYVASGASVTALPLNGS